jgi:gliding motility-associated-like protein
MVNSAGVYSLTVTNAANGCSATASATASANTMLPTAVAASPQALTCAVSQVTLSGAGSSTGVGITYQWAGPGIVSGGGTLSPTVNATGLYTLTVTDQANGCTTTSTATVASDGNSISVMIASLATLTCLVKQVTLNAQVTSSGSMYTYQWSTSGGHLVSGQNTGMPVADMVGLYNLTVTNPVNGCTGTAEATVVENVVLPNADAGPGGLLTCQATSDTLHGSSLTPGVVFHWTTTAGHILAGQNTADPVVDGTGKYTLLVTNPANGCTATDSTTVSKPGVNFPTTSVTTPDCEHPTGSILYSGGLGNLMYSIDNGATFQTDSLFDHLQPGTYDGVVEDAGGCKQTYSMLLTAATPLTISLPDSISIDPGQSALLEPVLNVPAADISSVIWVPATWLNCTGCLSPQATPLADVRYTVYITNSNGCSAVDSIWVHLKTSSPATGGVYVPNSFSPNGDGANDVFGVYTKLMVDRFEMQVYDRWGDQVFSSLDVSRGWDGTAKGKPQNPGVYVYWIRMDVMNGQGEMEQRVVKGDVLLVR